VKDEGAIRERLRESEDMLRRLEEDLERARTRVYMERENPVPRVQEVDYLLDLIAREKREISVLKWILEVEG